MFVIKFFNREAVATQSPGLPRFGGYPGKGRTNDPTPTGLRLTLRIEPRESRETDATSSRLEPRCIYSQGSRQSPATLGSGSQPLRG